MGRQDEPIWGPPPATGEEWAEARHRVRLHTEVVRRERDLPHYLTTLHQLRRSIESIRINLNPWPSEDALLLHYKQHLKGDARALSIFLEAFDAASKR